MKTLLLLIAAFIFVFHGDARACSYGPGGFKIAAQKAVEEADFIFSARVLGHVESGHYKGKIILKPVENYKNKVGGLIPAEHLFIGTGGGDCGAYLQIGPIYNLAVKLDSTKTYSDGMPAPLSIRWHTQIVSQNFVSEQKTNWVHSSETYNVDPDLISQEVFVHPMQKYLKDFGLEYQKKNKEAVIEASMNMLNSCKQHVVGIKTAYVHPYILPTILKISYVDDLDIKIAGKVLKFNGISLRYDKENSKISDEIIISDGDSVITLLNCDVPELTDLFEKTP